MNVQIGDSVQKGDVLMTIESNDYLAGYTEANAAYELAQIQAKQAASAAVRFKHSRRGSRHSNSMGRSRHRCPTAKGQATRAKAGLDIATSRLQDTKLKSPFAGIIVSEY